MSRETVDEESSIPDIAEGTAEERIEMEVNGIKSASVAESDHTVQHTVLSGNRLERIHIIGIQC